MKAKCVIFPALQKPMTVFGMPPMGLVALGGGVGFGYVAPLLIGLPELSFLTALMFGAVAVIWSVTGYRRDHHFDTLLQLPTQFWRKSKRGAPRHLIAGNKQ